MTTGAVNLPVVLKSKCLTAKVINNRLPYILLHFFIYKERKYVINKTPSLPKVVMGKPISRDTTIPDTSIFYIITK
ncbi:hypothetical protein VNO78_23168 [Psophocarpus tetragonolobus]|uniref:Uncharacterized protein n=1 Tax=Psophocarpus tetragonolobus TaxID=3891 RepID=A0AAN9S670_PSOTE